MNIIINSPFSSSWAARDERALSGSHEHLKLFDGFKKSLLTGATGILALLWKNRRNETIWVHQSAGHASLIPCLFGHFLGHKNIIIAIGTDSACFPEIDYGNYRKWSTRLSTRISFKRADLICPVHESMECYDYDYWDVRHKKQGIKAFIPELETPFFAVPNGYDSANWGVDKKWFERRIDVLCVFSLGARNRSVLKGADLILMVAGRRPEIRFRIIGEVPKGVNLPQNCEVVPNCTSQELRYHYNDARIFVQASITEGFPNTLCEAMACGCFPIGSNVSSIPAIISNYGFILTRRDGSLLEELISQGIEHANDKDGIPKEAEISASIFERYHILRRRDNLLRAIEMVRYDQGVESNLQNIETER
ncbi:glycosyltransferase [Flavobacteriales bacterium]|nr:glycosyltransferase [Flavobacteriales bacterium]